MRHPGSFEGVFRRQTEGGAGSGSCGPRACNPPPGRRFGSAGGHYDPQRERLGGRGVQTKPEAGGGLRTPAGWNSLSHLGDPRGPERPKMVEEEAAVERRGAQRPAS